VPHDQLPSFLAKANIFVLPSVNATDGDRDGLPVTLLEAAATSLPIIASDIGGVGEFIVDHFNGLLVQPGDVGALSRALDKLLHNKDLCQRFARNASVAVESYDWAIVADQYARVLQSALSGAPENYSNPERAAPSGGKPPCGGDID
jgi:glycosyltransferase involved in cell wall biosynthesis